MKPTPKQRNIKGAPGMPAALRALRRAAHKVHAENRKLGLPVILWQDGKVVQKPGLNDVIPLGFNGVQRVLNIFWTTTCNRVRPAFLDRFQFLVAGER